MRTHESLPTIKPVAIALLNKILAKNQGKLQIADLGSGSEPKILLGLNYRGLIVYYAVDSDSKRLKRLKEDTKNLSTKLVTVCADLQKLPLKSRRFDIILFFETIEHLKNPDRAMKEIIRIAKLNAIVLLSTPNIDRPDISIKRLFLLLVGIKEKYPEDYFYDPEHVKEWERKDFAAFLEKSGLKVKKWVPISYPLEYVGFRSLATIIIYPFLNLLIKINPNFSPILFAVCKIKK